MIQPLFNGMLAILLAKFCLNDIPHAAGITGSSYDRPPTIGQLRYITGLRQRLKMTIVYEREVVTFGEAGRMIRELEAEEKHRKRLESGGSNPTPTARKFTQEIYENFYIDEFGPKYVDPFSPTYIEEALPDTTEVDDAVNLLSHEMYMLGGSPILVYREPDGKPLGYAVFQTGFNKIVGGNTLDIFLLGSLTDEPGIGTHIISRLTDMAKEQNLMALTATAKQRDLLPFYQRLGFVSFLDKELGMIKRLKRGN